MRPAVPLRQWMQVRKLLGRIEVNARSSILQIRWRAIGALLVLSRSWLVTVVIY